MNDALAELEMRAERVARPGQDRHPTAPPGARASPADRWRDRTTDRTPRYFSISAATGPGDIATPSMIALARRVSGMLAGSITSRWAFHSAAMACASASVGRSKFTARRRMHRLVIEGHTVAARRASSTAARSVEAATQTPAAPPRRAAVIGSSTGMVSNKSRIGHNLPYLFNELHHDRRIAQRGTPDIQRLRPFAARFR